MAINNDRSLLEQQILSNSGLKGKELENLKARLATLSEQQLQAELSKSLSGNNKGEWYTGVMLEHNESVVMRNNHDQITYTDDNGNEITELKDGDDVVERTIKSTDDKGNVFETTVTFSGGRPLTQTKTKNGNTTETTTYKYNDDAEVPFVTVETKKADRSKVMTNVLEVDENGNFAGEDFIDRQTTSMDGTTTHIFTVNNCVVEQQVKPNGKKVDTIYKGDSIEDYDNKKLNRVYQKTEQNGEVHEVEYDGNGNTRTVVQNGESPAAIAKKFGVKESSLRKLNPARGKNSITQVGADIVVPGEYDADARVMTRRKTKQGAMQDFASDEVQRTAERLYSSTMQEVTLDKDYKDAYAYARALLAADGVKNPSNQQVNNKANEILVANGNIKFKKGTKVHIATKAPDSKFVQELSNNGFKPTRENAIFYNRFNALNPTQQQNVLSVIKYCKSQNITDPNQIKARILETFPEINLFDSGKLIPINPSFGNTYQRKNPVALETFLTETLKLDLKSDVGRQVYERLASLPQEELGRINGSNFSDMSKAYFDEIANSFETSGVNIRTQMEYEMELNRRNLQAERLGIPQQKFTSEMLANIYDRAADMMEQYYHNHGVFDAGTYLEGMKNLMDWITPDNLFGIDMRSTLHVASDCRKAAQRFRQMHTDSPETFKREYAQLKKDGLVTADYNQQNVQEFMNLIQSGEVDINSDKFKNACQKAFGFKGVENTEKYIQTGEMAGNIGDIAVMLYTLGAASELKMMGKATTGVYGALERGAGKFMGKTAAQKTAKVGTSMLMGGTTLGGFTLGKETLNNLSNPMRDATSWETWKQTGIASAESFGFGAFGGLLNETVVAPIVKAIEKPATKATQTVSKALTEQGELTGKQIMETVSESGSLKLDGLFKMNSQEWANLARTATAKGVGFGVEVTGFTAYEAGLDIIKDLIDPNTGRLPDNITVESLTKYLGEKFGEQFSNLGTIKGISQLLMMSKGGKVAQKAMMNEILSKSDALKDIKFKKAEINGHEVYEVTYPNGNRAVVSSPEQAIATCQMAMQMEFLAKSLTDNEPKSKNTKSQKSPVLSRLETANDRESFVTIRDEIKKMPNGEEKTQLMQAYLKKYNEWSADPARPDIRTQYIPTSENPHNIVNIETAEEVGAKAQQALSGSTHRIATAGYSAPPEGYENTTRDFLRALDSQLGSEQTAFVTSPTADKGSIDAITSEVAGFKDGRLFYTTAQDYVEYINPENFPPSIDGQAYAKVPKFVLPDATSYSQATAEASNAFIATGGRNATVSDFVNAIKKGNKAVILDNTTLEVPAWGDAKGRVENASKYLSEQIKAVKEGKPLPYPEIGEFTRAFIETNMSKIDNLVRTYQVDGKTESVNRAATQAAQFIKGVVPEPTLTTTSKISIDSPEFQAVKTELTDLYKKKNLTDNEKIRVTELEAEVQKQGILVAKSPLIEQIKISMLAKAEPREAFLPDFNNEAQLKEMGFTKEKDGKWYHSNRDWYPDALSDKDVVYVFKRDASGKAIDTGFGPKDELPSLYVRSEDFDNNNMRFVQPSEMKPGQPISVKKCASGTFCILPVGTKLFSSEGIVEVKPGEIVNIKGDKNSIHTSKMSDVPDMYKADPLNPASKELFDLINEYKSKEITMSETEKIQFQAKISDAFSRVNRGQKLIEILGTGENAPKTLRDEYDVAARISKTIDEKYLSRIDCSDFDKGLEEAGRIMDEILADKTLNDAQKQAAMMGVMTHMVTTTNLHQHGKGSTPKEVTLALAREKGLPESTIADIEAAYAQADKGYPVLSEFNKAYDVIGQVIRTPEDYKASIDGIIRESMKRGQLICEVRCACDSLRDAKTGQSLSPREGTLAIMKAIEEVKAEIRAEGLEPPETSFVFLTFRGKGWDGSLPMAVTQAKEAVRIAEEHPEMKFGYDVAGPEDTGWGPKAFKEATDIINRHNEDVKAGRKKGNPIGITMHAGETPTYEGGEGYKSVLDAIDMGAVRIGHGIQLAKYLKEMETKNPEEFNRVLNLVKEKGIAIEICGVCNIQSIPINSEGMEQHAIQTFLDYGIPVTICTDNDAICGTNISKEYTQFLLTGHSNFMDWNAIKQSVRDGVDAAFITDSQKAKVRTELDRRIGLVQKCYDNAIARAEYNTKIEKRDAAIERAKQRAAENKPAPIIATIASLHASKGEPTNAHLSQYTTASSPTEFYDNLSVDKKALVDKYKIPHDDIISIHGILRQKLTKYDTPEIIEARYMTATGGGSLSAADIPVETIQEIVEIEHVKMAPIPAGKTLYMITGRAGGGKTTIAKQLGLDKSCYMPDADDIKAFLPGYSQPGGSNYVHNASVAINTAMINEAFSRGLNMVVQTTGWEAYMDEIIAEAKKNGYTDIRLIHSNVSTDNSIQRANSRAEATGRYVDPAFIEQRTYIDEVVNRFNNQEKGLTELIVYDNNGSEPVQVQKYEFTPRQRRPQHGI